MSELEWVFVGFVTVVATHFVLCLWTGRIPLGGSPLRPAYGARDDAPVLYWLIMAGQALVLATLLIGLLGVLKPELVAWIPQTPDLAPQYVPKWMAEQIERRKAS